MTNPSIDQIVTVGGIDWRIAAITDVVVTCRRSDVTGEPDHYLKIFTYPKKLHDRIAAGEFAGLAKFQERPQPVEHKPDAFKRFCMGAA